LPFGVEGKPIVGPFWTAWLILQGLVEGGEGPTAEFIEVTAADAGLRRDLGECRATEEVENGCDPLRHFGRWEHPDGGHGNFLLVVGRTQVIQ
jgi:hypothetical protein